MENIILIGTVAFVHLLGAISPGPNFLITVKNSLSYSRKTGIYTVLGITTGYLIYIILCLTGLAIIISKSVIIFSIIKYLGAGYLIYLGIKSLLNKSDIKIGNNKIKKQTDISKFQAIKSGLLVFLANPKAALFWLGIFAVAIPPKTPVSILTIMIIVMCVNGFLWYSLVAVFFTQKKVQSVFLKFQNTFNKIFGGLLILLGLKIALSEK